MFLSAVARSNLICFIKVVHILEDLGITKYLLFFTCPKDEIATSIVEAIMSLGKNLINALQKA